MLSCRVDPSHFAGRQIKQVVRERIGRFKYTHEDRLDAEFDSVMADLTKEIAACCGKEDF